MEWSEVIDTLTSAGKGAADVYNAFVGTSSATDEETAYLQGMIAGTTQAQNRQDAAETIKIGDLEISTNSILWIIGGTLGLLAVGLGIKKML